MYNKVIKRLFDIVLSIIGLIFSIPIFIVIALLIFIEDKGPIFYNASRLGRKGKIFKMYKFRSMKVNAPDIRNADGSTYNGDNDPRLTKIGRFIRKTSIDELPQLINVFIGNMSFIGPRPHLVTDYKGYDSLSEDGKRRLAVRPGITGYSQAFYRNSVNSDEKIKNDVYYANNISFILDVKIFFKTISSVLKRENIYVDVNGGNMKKLLIIGASVLQVPAIKKAKELGYYVGVIDYNPKAVGIQYADEFFNVSTIDIEGVIKTAEEFKPQGIVTLATDMPMRSIAAACEKLNLHGITMDTAIKSTDKGEMIKTFEMYNVEHPWYKIANDENEFNKIKKKIKFPCIMKPTDNSGSRGVVLANSLKELEESYYYTKENARKGAVIIEEYMQGNEVSVEIITIDDEPHVLAVTDKLTTGAPHFVEMGHSQQSLLGKKNVDKIKDLACRAVKAVGIKNGPAHVEIMLTKDGPKMVELGARMGGDCITTHLVPLSTGIDMVEATIKIACGEKVDIEPKFNKGSAIRYFDVPNGVIESISNIEEAKKIDGVKEITFVKNVGDEVGDINSSVDRIGFVIAQADTPKGAIKICKEAINMVKVEVKKNEYKKRVKR